MATVSLKKECVRHCVFRAHNTTDAVLHLHFYAFSRARVKPAEMPTLQEHLTCNEATALQICRWFIEKEKLDNARRPETKQVMPGGAWLNYGFSTAPGLRDWQVELPACDLS